MRHDHWYDGFVVDGDRAGRIQDLRRLLDDVLLGLRAAGLEPEGPFLLRQRLVISLGQQVISVSVACAEPELEDAATVTTTEIGFVVWSRSSDAPARERIVDVVEQVVRAAVQDPAPRPTPSRHVTEPTVPSLAAVGAEAASMARAVAIEGEAPGWFARR